MYICIYAFAERTACRCTWTCCSCMWSSFASPVACWLLFVCVQTSFYSIPVFTGMRCTQNTNPNAASPPQCMHASIVSITACAHCAEPAPSSTFEHEVVRTKAEPQLALLLSCLTQASVKDKAELLGWPAGGNKTLGRKQSHNLLCC